MHYGRECVIITAEGMNSRKNPERNTDTGCCSSTVGQVFREVAEEIIRQKAA